MWGDAILVAPKITAPSLSQKKNSMQSVNYFLPEGYLWYNYDSKTID